MPIYQYTCNKPIEERCKIANLPEEFFNGDDIGFNVNLEAKSIVSDEEGNIDADASPLVWLENHGMFENVNITCPVCEGSARKIISVVNSYIKGNCYLDIEGCKKDMNLYKLQNDDPYGHMRPPGEKDELIAKIKRGNKPKPKTYLMGGSQK